MQISTVKDFIYQDKKINQGIDLKEHTDTKLKDNLNKNTVANNSVKVTINDRPDSVVYTKNGYINKKSDTTTLSGSSGWDVAKEVGLSVIPVYGTIREFQKGNIGWGILGILTDILSLVPVIGSGVKALGTAIRGGSAAVKAARVGLAAAEVTSKMTTSTIARQFAVGASEGLAKSGKELGKSVLRAADPGIELLYKGGKSIRSGTAKIFTAPTKAAISAKTTNIILEKIKTLCTKKPDVKEIFNYAHDFIKKTDYSWHVANKENQLKLFDHAARREFNRDFLLKDINKFSLEEKKKMLINMESKFGIRLRGITDFIAEKVGYNSENSKLVSTASKYTPLMEDITYLLKVQVGELPSKISSPLYIKNVNELNKVEINAISDIGIKINDLT